MAEGEGGGNDTDDSQKTEEPTARRLEEARKRGQVIHSREVTSWLVLFAATILLISVGPSAVSDLKEQMRFFMSQAHSIPADTMGLRRVSMDILKDTAGFLLLPLLILGIVGGLSSFIQTGPIFSAEQMKPNISKISLIKGFGRLFSMRSVVEFIKGLLKLTVVSTAITLVLMPYFGGIEHFVGQDVTAAMYDMRDLFIKMMVATLSILFILAIGDYLYQRYDFIKKMMMSKQEMKDEFKQTEGDPLVKSKLRQLREAKARQRMMQAVPEADVVITNPTHFAVALKYDPKNMGAPVMVAKGVDAVAERIREVAKEHKVTIVENAPLARSLFDSMEIDQVIPQEHFKAVAEVISYVFKLKGKRV
jgi:flagellar biosynthetic protein FlhB